MPLYEIVKADGTREKVEADYAFIEQPYLFIIRNADKPSRSIATYAPGTWLEVWRREGVGA